MKVDKPGHHIGSLQIHRLIAGELLRHGTDRLNDLPVDKDRHPLPGRHVLPAVKNDPVDQCVFHPKFLPFRKNSPGFLF